MLAPLAAPTHRGNKEGKGPANICPGGGGGANIPGFDGGRSGHRRDVRLDEPARSPTLLAPAKECCDNDKMTGKTLAARITSRRESGAGGASQRSARWHSRSLQGTGGPHHSHRHEHRRTYLHDAALGDSPTTQQEAFLANPLLKDVKNLDTQWGRRGTAALAASSTLLFSAGQTADNAPKLFAIDKKTGKRVGAVATPRLGQYGLMTVRSDNGKQYIVLPVNGGYTAMALP